MKKILLLCFFLFSFLILDFTNSYCQAPPYTNDIHWQVDSLSIPLYSKPDYNNFSIEEYQMLFVDSLTGYITCVGSFAGYLIFLKTNDGGQSWSKIWEDSVWVQRDSLGNIIDTLFDPAGTPIKLIAISKDTLIECVSTNGYCLYYSYNGGYTWVRYHYTISDGFGIKSFDMLKNGYGLMCSYNYIYKTTNYGLTWHIIKSLDSIKIKGSVPYPTYIKIFSENNIQIVCHTNYLYSYYDSLYLIRTTDEFNTYEVTKNPIPFRYYLSMSGSGNINNYDEFDYYWQDWNTFLVAGLNRISDKDQRLDLFKTTNFGQKWELIMETSIYPKYSDFFNTILAFVTFQDSLRGMVGLNDEKYYTIDGGKRWHKINTYPQIIYNDPVEIGQVDTVGYAHTICGGHFNNNNQIILKEYSIRNSLSGEYLMWKYNYGVTDTSSVQDAPHINSKQTIVCPNPVQDILTISNLPNDFDYNTTIEIYNIYGLKVIEIPYTDKIDVSKLSTGVYYLKINNQFTKFVKFIK